MLALKKSRMPLEYPGKSKKISFGERRLTTILEVSQEGDSFYFYISQKTNLPTIPEAYKNAIGNHLPR